MVMPGVAVVEIGSNGLKMSIKNDDYSFFSYKPLPVEMVDEKHIAGKDLAEKIWGFVLEASARKVHPENIEIIATGGFRIAENSEEVLNEISKKCNIYARIIHPLEEARLTAAAACERVRFKGYALVVDSGGASTELILANKQKNGKIDILSKTSIPLGSKVWKKYSEEERNKIIAKYIKLFQKNCEWDEIKSNISMVITNSNAVSRIVSKMNYKGEGTYRYNAAITAFTAKADIGEYRKVSEQIAKMPSQEVLQEQYASGATLLQFMPAMEVFNKVLDGLKLEKGTVKPQIFKPGDGLLMQKYRKAKTKEAVSCIEGEVIETGKGKMQDWHKPIAGFYKKSAASHEKKIEIIPQKDKSLIMKSEKGKVQYEEETKIKVENADYQMVYDMLKERQTNANVKKIDMAGIKSQKLQINMVLAATSLGITVLNMPDLTKMNIDKKLISYTEMKQQELRKPQRPKANDSRPAPKMQEKTRPV